MNGFLASVRQVGQGLVYIEPLTGGHPDQGLPGWEHPSDPGYGRPEGGGGRPDQGLPGGGFPGQGRPDQGLPGGGYPGQGRPGQGLPGGGFPGQGRPDQGLPVPPVKPSPPITLPPGTWPPQLPGGAHVDNTLPGNYQPGQPIVIPPDPELGIEQPIVLPSLPPGTALLIALPQAQPKAGTPPGAKPAILYQPGKAPVVVYVSAAPTPK